MSAFYYISAGGTATGDLGRASTKRTGSFAAMGASTYYATGTAMLLAIVTPLTSADFICIPDTYSQTFHTTFNNAAFNGATLISVDALNADVYKAGARLTSSDFVNAGGLSGVGCDVTTLDDLTYSNNTAICNFEDSSVGTTTTGTSDPLIMGSSSSYGARISLFNCLMDVGTASTSPIAIGGAAHVEMAFCTSVRQRTDYLFDATGRGTNLHVHDTDLSQFLTASQSLFLDLAAEASLYARFERCKLPSNVSLFSVAPTQQWWDINISNCTNPATPDHDAMYYFQRDNPIGNAEAVIVNYLAGTYDGVNGVSVSISSTAICGVGRPFRQLLAKLPAQDLTSSSTFTVNFISEDTIYTNEVWVEISRPDATDQSLGVVQSSRATDLFSADIPSTTNAESWTETAYTTPVKQSTSIVVDALAGVDDALVDVYICCAKPSLDFNVDIAVIKS